MLASEIPAPIYFKLLRHVGARFSAGFPSLVPSSVFSVKAVTAFGGVNAREGTPDKALFQGDNYEAFRFK